MDFLNVPFTVRLNGKDERKGPEIISGIFGRLAYHESEENRAEDVQCTLFKLGDDERKCPIRQTLESMTYYQVSFMYEYQIPLASLAGRRKSRQQTHYTYAKTNFQVSKLACRDPSRICFFNAFLLCLLNINLLSINFRVFPCSARNIGSGGSGDNHP